MRRVSRLSVVGAGPSEQGEYSCLTETFPLEKPPEKQETGGFFQKGFRRKDAEGEELLRDTQDDVGDEAESTRRRDYRWC